MCCSRLPLEFEQKAIFPQKNTAPQTKNNHHTQNILTFPPQLSHSTRLVARLLRFLDSATYPPFSLSPHDSPLHRHTHSQRIKKKKNFQQVTSSLSPMATKVLLAAPPMAGSDRPARQHRTQMKAKSRITPFWGDFPHYHHQHSRT